MPGRFRSSGVALPIFSLPSPYGIGNIGLAAKEFIDFLSQSGFSYWSILPLGPTSFGDSPFSSYSSRALNHYLIDLDDLIENGLLKKKDLNGIDWGSDPRKIDYSKIYANRTYVLKKAFKRFKRGLGDYQRGYVSFLRKKQFSDYACFIVLKELHGGKPWNKFDDKYKYYSKDLFNSIKKEYAQEVEFYEWTQYIFLKQWASLKDYAHEKGIKIIGTMPMHVSFDSVDVYKHRKNFLLDSAYEMEETAGYPPDVFYYEGQNWGLPLYDFEYMKKNGYSFFKNRFNFCLELYDIVSLDHFRGYIENYMIPRESKDGMRGRWEKTPGIEVLESFILDKSRVVAEDVDFSSEELNETLSELKINDMRVIEFGFPREDTNINKPSNYPYSCFSYSSTHDCLPLKGYFESMDYERRKKVSDELNKCCHHFGVNETVPENIEGMVESVLELNLASLSSVAIQSMSDLLYQGNESRINSPSTIGNNWQYRVTYDDVSPLNAKKLRELNRRFGRCD